MHVRTNIRVLTMKHFSICRIFQTYFFSQGFQMLTIDLVAASGLEFLDILAAKFSDEAIEVNELLLPKS